MDQLIEELVGYPPGRSVIVSGENGLYTPCLGSVLKFFSSPGNSFDLYKVDESNEMNEDLVEFVYQVPTGVVYDKRAYAIRCRVKNVLDSESHNAFTNKASLYKMMTKLNPGNVGFFMPTSWQLKDFDSRKMTGRPFIVKPTGHRTGCGRGNSVITTSDDLVLTREHLSNLKFSPEEAIISTYITSPVLFEGRKTHFRSYLMISSDGRVNVFDKVTVRLARKEYVRGEWNDQDIHDTHTSSSGVDIHLPIDTTPKRTYVSNGKRVPRPHSIFKNGEVFSEPKRFSHLNIYYDDVIKATKRVGELIKREIVPKSPAEALRAFEVYAIDFIVTPSHRVYLLEMNTKVSYKSAVTHVVTNEHIMFSTAYFEWMYRHGYLPFASPPRTFAISGGTGLHTAYLEDALRSFGWTPHTESYVYFNYLEKLSHDLRHYDSSLVGVRCHYKNILPPSKMCIADKGEMYKNISSILPDSVAESWLNESISEVPEDAKRGVMIVRPIGDIADSGYGIRVTNSVDHFDYAIKSVQKEIAESNGRLRSLIASRYIINPMLYNGKKYHLRSFFIYRVDSRGDGVRWDVFNRSRVVTAKMPYVEGDWANKLIHDTHSGTTEHNIFVDTPPEVSHIANALGEIMMRSNVRPYEESKVGYEVFGLDILPSPSGLKLLEVNSRVGMKDLGDPPGCPYEDTFTKFSLDYFNWMLKVSL